MTESASDQASESEACRLCCVPSATGPAGIVCPAWSGPGAMPWDSGASPLRTSPPGGLNGAASWGPVGSTGEGTEPMPAAVVNIGSCATSAGTKPMPCNCLVGFPKCPVDLTTCSTGGTGEGPAVKVMPAGAVWVRTGAAAAFIAGWLLMAASVAMGVLVTPGP